MARGGRINVRVGADTSKFKRAMAGVKTTVKGVGAAVKSAVAPIALMTGAVAALSGVLVGRGIRSVITLGAELDHLKDQTGISAGKLMILRQAFEDSGVSGEKVGKTINKMQQVISEGSNGLKTYADAFKMIGLSVKDLEGMDVRDQFTAIAKALSTTESATDKANAALKIFGRSGTELFPLLNKFGEGGDPFADVDASIGEFAKNMDQVSHLFEKVDTLIGRWKIKFTSMFEPVVTRFIEPLTNVLEKIDKTSFSKFGEVVADVMAKLANAFKEGKLGTLLVSALQVGFMKGAAVLQGVFKGLFAVLKSLFGQLVSTLPANFQEVINGMLSGLAGLFKSLLDAVAALLGGTRMNGLQQVGTLKYLDQQGFTNNSGGFGAKRTFTDSGEELFEKFKGIKAGRGDDISGLQNLNAKERVKQMFQSLTDDPGLAAKLLTPNLSDVGFNALTGKPQGIALNAGEAFRAEMENIPTSALSTEANAKLKDLVDQFKALSTTMGTGPLKAATQATGKPGMVEDMMTTGTSTSGPVVSALQSIGGGGGIAGLSLTESLLERAANASERTVDKVAEVVSALRGQTPLAVQ